MQEVVLKTVHVMKQSKDSFKKLLYCFYITSICCVGWFGKIALNKVIRNEQILILILIDEDTCWKFGGERFLEELKVLVKD